MLVCKEGRELQKDEKWSDMKTRTRRNDLTKSAAVGGVTINEKALTHHEEKQPAGPCRPSTQVSVLVPPPPTPDELRQQTRREGQRSVMAEVMREQSELGQLRIVRLGR